MEGNRPARQRRGVYLPPRQHLAGDEGGTGYYECDSVEFAAKVQADSPVVDRWNEYMKDVMVMEMDPVTGAQPLMKQVFFFDPE